MAYADRIDPAHTPGNVADLDFDPEPGEDDLRRYLRG
jgi:hypothetical protein